MNYIVSEKHNLLISLFNTYYISKHFVKFSNECLSCNKNNIDIFGLCETQLCNATYILYEFIRYNAYYNESNKNVGFASYIHEKTCILGN